MENRSGDHVLVRKVLRNILTTYPEPSPDKLLTRKSIEEALSSLAPFKPPKADIDAINQVLLNREASEVACKAAWALYKDYALNDKG